MSSSVNYGAAGMWLGRDLTKAIGVTGKLSTPYILDSSNTALSFSDTAWSWIGLSLVRTLPSQDPPGERKVKRFFFLKYENGIEGNLNGCLPSSSQNYASAGSLLAAEIIKGFGKNGKPVVPCEMVALACLVCRP